MDIRVPKMNVAIVSSFFLPLNQIRHSVHEKNDKKKTKAMPKAQVTTESP